MNLLKETLKILKENKKEQKDILWCGSKEFGYFSFEEFKKISNEEYDDGFGGQEVVTDILIVGKDFWLERHEYDGSEWWEFKSIPKKPKKQNIPKKVISKDSWSTLEEANRVGGKYNY